MRLNKNSAVSNCSRLVKGVQSVMSRAGGGGGGSLSSKKLPCRSQGLAEDKSKNYH